ncbi:hypothetical protein TOL_0467 [Thalassolituus oleivorans MIL-1]|uniref:Uncharacterized protein n=1 Tax=Thalassolituus oleivorans MIL-1 TaxID=1298593 RepID=M5DN96_9GAMM|nr:hypothetical protein TOL_0467 [Thalassolituus oleivorans MIL-1]
MAIINTECKCGKKITVRTNADSKGTFRKDRKQVIYTDQPLTDDGREYDIFRCESCSEPIAQSCADAAYE